MPETIAPSQLPPKGLRAGGRRLWKRLCEHLTFDAQELALLTEVCRVADRLDALDAVIRKAGPVLPDQRPHPALAEARQQALVFARLIVALRLPEDLLRPERRPQRRGVRGLYSIGREAS